VLRAVGLLFPEPEMSVVVEIAVVAQEMAVVCTDEIADVKEVMAFMMRR
jgi:hypothetical protein